MTNVVLCNLPTDRSPTPGYHDDHQIDEHRFVALSLSSGWSRALSSKCTGIPVKSNVRHDEKFLWNEISAKIEFTWVGDGETPPRAGAMDGWFATC